MARHFSRRSRGHRRPNRKIRWDGQIAQANVSLEANGSGTDYETFSFWVKAPASMTINATQTITSPAVLATNEPVDETLVRLFSKVDAILTQPGTGGIAELVNWCFGIIPWDGGANPDYYDFRAFPPSAGGAPPHPFFDTDDPWVWRKSVGTGNLELIDLGGSGRYEKEEWVKSMRKLPAGKGLLFVCAAVSLLTVASYTVLLNLTTEQRYAVKSGFSA